MFASIRKFSKSIFAKIFIAIIALPFIMWGMGDVFRSGKQNVLLEINEEKINSGCPKNNVASGILSSISILRYSIISLYNK